MISGGASKAETADAGVHWLGGTADGNSLGGDVAADEGVNWLGGTADADVG